MIPDYAKNECGASSSQSEPLCHLPGSSATRVLPALPACAAIPGQPLSAASQWPENLFSALDTVVAAPSRAAPNDNVFTNSTIISDAAHSMPDPVLKFSALSAIPELLQPPAASASHSQLPTAAPSLLHAAACRAASPAVLTSFPLPPLPGSSDAGAPPAMETQSAPTVSSPTKPSESPLAFQMNFRPPTETFCKPGFSGIPGQLGGTYAPWIPPHLPSGNLRVGAGSGSVCRVCPPSDLMASAVIALPIPAVSVSADLSLSAPQWAPGVWYWDQPVQLPLWWGSKAMLPYLLTVLVLATLGLLKATASHRTCICPGVPQAGPH
jgi:hypothetical protein